MRPKHRNYIGSPCRPRGFPFTGLLFLTTTKTQSSYLPTPPLQHGRRWGVRLRKRVVQVQVQVHLFTLIQLQYNNNKE